MSSDSSCYEGVRLRGGGRRMGGRETNVRMNNVKEKEKRNKVQLGT